MQRVGPVISLLILLVGVNAVSAQTDWSEAFPEIKGCVKNIGRLEREGSVITQTAFYNSRSSPCGTIAFRAMPGIRASREDSIPDILTRHYKVRGYDAWQTSPLCGTPPSGGFTIAVHFATDVVLEVNAEGYEGEEILVFPQRADYRLLKRVTYAVKGAGK